MSEMGRVTLFAAALGVALGAGAAFAQTSPPDPLAPGAGAEPAAKNAAADRTDADAPKRHRAKPHGEREGATIAVGVHNDRSVGMVELRLGPAGAPELKKVVGPLAFGRKTVIHVRRTKDCLYDIHAHFADDADTDQSGVNLCADKSINLTD